jgi:Flp pilus assembly pilin Flp
MSDLILRTSVKAVCTRDRAVDSLRNVLLRLRDNESGQDMIEYIGVLVVVAAVIVGALGIFDTGFFNTIGSKVSHEITTIFSAGPGGGGSGTSTTPGG